MPGETNIMSGSRPVQALAALLAPSWPLSGLVASTSPRGTNITRINPGTLARNAQVKNQTWPTLVSSGPDRNPDTVLPSDTTAVANA